MWDKLLLKLKLMRSNSNTRRQLEKRLCNYKSAFTAYDLHTLYELIKRGGAPTTIYQEYGRTIEVNIDSTPIDWFMFRIKYSVDPMDMDIIMVIQVFAGAPQVGSMESDTINLRVESITDNGRPRRKIVERNLTFINAIAFENLESNCKTPKVENDLTVIKKILAYSFSVIINHIIDWRMIS